MTRLTAILLILCALVLPATAQEKPLRGIALVIGQSKYLHLPALANPENDARAIEALLEDLGFEVSGATDRDAKKLRRDLERFAEDAEGADAAIIYYSGHGIEAGGENWLVPVDADLQALDNVRQNLVPMSSILDELRARVPLTIFLLDACRTSPFPPGAIARSNGETFAVGRAGLGIPRGFATIESGATDEVGTVIGFAAEPGLPALDGEPGASSPYAAAILRHLSAMTGAEFGMVMRMVTEEVYLKTATRQRPWVNESLRKQLFFGAPGGLPEGEAGIITGERRKLLLTISNLPGPQRAQVERIADTGQVPLDTLYGVLAALGETEMPRDPQALDVALRGQAARLKVILDERKALATGDPELKRLVQAADMALAEGAIKAARGFLDQAKVSIEKSRGGIEAVEAQARAKRIANAEILLKSAETAEIDFDFAAAARDYNAAFGWVKDADKALAAKYKTYEADALQGAGNFRGDRQAYAGAIAAYEQALAILGPGGDDVLQRSKTTNNLANTYLQIGIRDPQSAPLEKAIGFYRAVLAGSPETGSDRAVTLSNLGIALHTLAGRSNDGAMFDAAGRAFAEALSLRDKSEDAAGWSIDMLNAANLDMSLGQRNGDTSYYRSAEQKILAGLEALDPSINRVEWAQGKNNLAIVQRIQGANERDIAKIRAAAATYEEVLKVFDRATFPLDWGQTNGNLAIAHTNLGAFQFDMAEFESAAGFYRLALEEVTRERAPVFWATLQHSQGMNLQSMYALKQDAALLEAAVQSFRGALQVRARAIDPLQWAESQQMLASALSWLASARGDATMAGDAVAAYRAAREVYTPREYPGAWRTVTSGLASAIMNLGIQQQKLEDLRQALAIYEELAAASPRAQDPATWAGAMQSQGQVHYWLGAFGKDTAEFKLAIAAYDQALDEFRKSGSFMEAGITATMRDNAVKSMEIFK